MASNNEISVWIRLRDQFTAAFAKTQAKLKTGMASVKSQIFSLQGVATGFAGTMVFKVAKGFVDTAAEMETLKTRLIGITGSVEAANEAFKRIQKTASEVPYTIKEITEATVSLEAFGANSEAWTKPLIDLAAFMGVDLTEAAQAVGRAFAGGAGAADVLRERGVLAQVKLKAGFDDLSKVSLPEFRKLLLATLTDPDGKISGGADRLAGTWAGTVSMMQDAWTNLQLEIMDESNLEALKLTVEGVTEALKGMAKGFATVRTGFGKMLDFLWENLDAKELARKEQAKTNEALDGWKKRLEAILPRLEEMREQGLDNTEAYRSLVREAVSLDKTIRRFSEETAAQWHDRMVALKGAGDEVADSVRKVGDSVDDVVPPVSDKIKALQAILQDTAASSNAFMKAFQALYPEEALAIQRQVREDVARLNMQIRVVAENLDVIPPKMELLAMPETAKASIDNLTIGWTNFQVVATQAFASLQGAGVNVTQALDATMGRLASALTNQFQGIGESARWQFKTIYKSFERMVTQMIIKAAALKVIKGLFGGPLGFLFGEGGIRGIPAQHGLIAGIPAQHGRLVTGPTPIIAGESGPEMIAPLDRFEAVVVKALRKHGGGGVTINISAWDKQSVEDWFRGEGKRILQRVTGEGHKLISRRGLRD